MQPLRQVMMTLAYFFVPKSAILRSWRNQSPVKMRWSLLRSLIDMQQSMVVIRPIPVSKDLFEEVLSTESVVSQFGPNGS